jgi:hypothetical protein
VTEWQSTGFAKPGRRVIRDAAAWKRLLTELSPYPGGGPRMPDVDFDKHIVLAAFMGSQSSTGGYGIRIYRIVRTDKEIRASVLSPPFMGMAPAFCAPAHYVVIPRPDVPVRFVDAHDPSSDRMGAVWVYRSDGSRQGEGGGVPPEKMKRELATSRRVHIYSMRAGHDGLMYPAVRGAPTGRINLYEIDCGGLDDAIAAGFHPINATVRKTNEL